MEVEGPPMPDHPGTESNDVAIIETYSYWGHTWCRWGYGHPQNACSNYSTHVWEWTPLGVTTKRGGDLTRDTPEPWVRGGFRPARHKKGGGYYLLTRFHKTVPIKESRLVFSVQAIRFHTTLHGTGLNY